MSGFINKTPDLNRKRSFIFKKKNFHDLEVQQMLQTFKTWCKNSRDGCMKKEMAESETFPVIKACCV